jgi:hypothetical protein
MNKVTVQNCGETTIAIKQSICGREPSVIVWPEFYIDELIESLKLVSRAPATTKLKTTMASHDGMILCHGSVEDDGQVVSATFIDPTGRVLPEVRTYSSIDNMNDREAFSHIKDTMKLKEHIDMYSDKDFPFGKEVTRELSYWSGELSVANIIKEA